jgi:hypothetical protein
MDKIWSFACAKNETAKKAKNAPEEAGDVWTWTANDADSKLIVLWLVGDRTTDSALRLVDDLKSRLANRVQLTSDGHRPYLAAVDTVFGDDIDYAMLNKIYGSPPTGEHRYSPAVGIGAQKKRVTGNPDAKHRQHVLCRACEPYDADARAPLHATEQRVLKEDRKPCGGGRAAYDVLKFRSRASDLENLADDGRWRHG